MNVDWSRFEQEQHFQLWERAPDSSAYNSGFTSVLRGPLDTAALQAATRMLFDRQQVWRSSAIAMLL